jgi:hypothetical protein
MKKKRPERWGGCERKKSYPTKRAALGAIHRHVEAGCNPQWAYKCTFCADWHLTAMSPGEIQRKIQK